MFSQAWPVGSALTNGELGFGTKRVQLVDCPCSVGVESAENFVSWLFKRLGALMEDKP